MKEVEHAVIHSAKADAQLVDAVPQVVGLGAAQFVAQLSQPLDFDTAFIERFLRETIEPVQEGNGPILFPVKDDLGLRHPYLLGTYVRLFTNRSQAALETRH